LSVATGGAAVADTPSGSYTSSYGMYDFTQLQTLLPRLQQSTFDLIDKNGDGYICFKFYNNTPDQRGQSGQAIDNKAGPHA
jgi:hypothetical protein